MPHQCELFSMSQWFMGFSQNILKVKDNLEHEQMLSYLEDLMEDATDLSWEKGKCCTCSLCCKLDKDTVTWGDTCRIVESRGLTLGSILLQSPVSVSM